MAELTRIQREKEAWRRSMRWTIRFEKKKPTDHFAEWQVEGPITSGTEVVPASLFDSLAEEMEKEMLAWEKEAALTPKQDEVVGAKARAEAFREAAQLVRQTRGGEARRENLADQLHDELLACPTCGSAVRGYTADGYMATRGGCPDPFHGHSREGG